MTLRLTVQLGQVAEGGPADASRRARVLSALSVDDDGSFVFEMGRPETGATCVLVDEGSELAVIVPLVRSPSSAVDLLPSLAASLAAIGGGLSGPGDHRVLTSDELVALWTQAHNAACREITEASRVGDAPPPPNLPRARLDELHRFLLVLGEKREAAQPILGLVERGSGITRLAVGLPQRSGTILAPPVDVFLWTVDDETWVLPAQGEVTAEGLLRVDLDAIDPKGFPPLADTRIVSPVEIIDTEALG